MIRKMLAAAVAVAALLVGVLSLSTTSAQADVSCAYYFPTKILWDIDNDGDDDLVNHPCAPIIAYTGPFTEMPPAPTGPYGFGSLNVVAAAPTGTGGGDAGAGLALTGSESTVIAYVGTGLIAFGAVALGSRRKFFQGALD